MSAALLAMINARKAAVSRIKTIKPALGRNRYRILPGWRVAAKAPAHLGTVPNAEGVSEVDLWLSQFYLDFGQHFLKDATGKVVAVALCPEKTYGKPCKVCDEVNRGIINSKNAGDKPTELRLMEALSGASILLNVLALDTPTPMTPEVLAVAPSIFNGKKGVGGIISLFTDWPKLVSLGGPGDGCADIIIEKAGAGKEGTTYSVAAVPTSVTLTPAIVALAKDLDQFVVNEDNSQSAARALSSVSAISGLLPAPSSPSMLGAAAAAFAPAAAAATTHFDDVPDFPTAAPVASTVPGATQVVAAVVPTVTAVAPTPAVQATVAPVQAPTAAQSPVAAAAPEQSLEDLLKDL